jgi:hypothetical protein
MPCNGVAVASVTVADDLKKFLGMLPQSAIDQAVIALVKAEGWNVTGKDGSFVASRIDKVSALSQMGIKSGNAGFSQSFRFTVKDGEVTIPNADLEKKLLALLIGLAGQVRQQVVAQAIAKAGAKIEKSQTAPNGALVLTVRL